MFSLLYTVHFCAAFRVIQYNRSFFFDFGPMFGTLSIRYP